MPKITLQQLNEIVNRAAKAATSAAAENAVAKARTYAAKAGAKKTAPVSLQDVNVKMMAANLQPVRGRPPTRAEVLAETGPGVHDEQTMLLGAIKAQRKLIRPKS